MQEQIVTFGGEASYSTLKKVRQVWDREVAESGGFQVDLKERSVLNAKKEATNAIRRELARDHPDIAKINAEYSLWKTTDEILQETILRTDGQTGLLKHMAEVGMGSGGMAAGSLLTGTLGGAMGGAAIAATLGKRPEDYVSVSQMENIQRNQETKTGRCADQREGRPDS